MIRIGQSSCRERVRRAFTLVELLVTIAIIAMLAGMLLFAMSGARTARDANTKAIIAKLNSVVMRKYEAYRTRRLPITIPAGSTAQQAATLRLRATRELMKMEMPDRWNDVPLLDMGTPAAGGNYSPILLPRSAVTRSYANKIGASYPTGTASQFQSAKLLYMMVMSDPDERERFSANEWKVVDDSQFPVFIDGWGRPISFGRWPAGFVSELHGPVSKVLQVTPLSAGMPPTVYAYRVGGETRLAATNGIYTGYTLVFTGGPSSPNKGVYRRVQNYTAAAPATRDLEILIAGSGTLTAPSVGDEFMVCGHDPFDPMNVEPDAYATYPLVYSAGPDGEHGIYTAAGLGYQYGYNTPPGAYNGIIDPFASPGGSQIGAPMTATEHIDNIHNHLIGTK